MDDALQAPTDQVAIPETTEEAEPQESPLATSRLPATVFSGCLAFSLPFIYVIFLLVEVTNSLWPPITVTLYGLMLFGSASLLLVFGAIRARVNLENSPGDAFVASMVIVAAVVLLVSFSQLGRHLYIAFGGFSAINTGYWHWLRFGFANLFEGAFFDIPAIYNWGVSEIQPTAFWSQTMVFLFRTSLELLIVANILGHLRNARQTWGRPHPKDHQTYLQFLLARLRGLLLLVVWGIPTVIGISAIVSDGFYLDSSWTAIRLSAPVILGAWLVWQSWRGFLNFSGASNRLLALAGIALGMWVAIANWTALRDYLGL